MCFGSSQQSSKNASRSSSAKRSRFDLKNSLKQNQKWQDFFKSKDASKRSNSRLGSNLKLKSPFSSLGSSALNPPKLKVPYTNKDKAERQLLLLLILNRRSLSSKDRVPKDPQQ